MSTCLLLNKLEIPPRGLAAFTIQEAEAPETSAKLSCGQQASTLGLLCYQQDSSIWWWAAVAAWVLQGCDTS